MLKHNWLARAAQTKAVMTKVKRGAAMFYWCKKIPRTAHSLCVAKISVINGYSEE